MATTLALLLVLTAVFLNTQAGFAVYFNGEQIGRTRSMEQVSAIVTGAEEQLSKIFDQVYSLDDAISVSPDLGVKADDAEHIKNAIVGSTEGVSEMYVLEVNGLAVGASDDAGALDGILDSILNEYTTPLTSSIRFTDTVTVSYRFMSNDTEQDIAASRRCWTPRTAPRRIS